MGISQFPMEKVSKTKQAPSLLRTFSSAKKDFWTGKPERNEQNT